MSCKESGRRSLFVCKYRENPSLKRISLERILRLPTSITFAQNSIGAILEFFGKASRMFLTNLAASNNDIPVPFKRVFAEIISLSMVLRILLSTYFYPHFIHSFIKRVYHVIRKFFYRALNRQKIIKFLTDCQ